MKIRILDIAYETMADGPGLRTSIYCAGCAHACPGCHNPQSWDFKGGNEMSVQDLLDVIKADEFADVTFTGGDPLYQVEAFTELARRIKEETGKTIWCYTGFTYEEIHDRMCEALESIGIDPDQVYVGKNDFYDMQRKKRMVEKERLPSVKEARQASDHLEAFRAFMAAEGKDIAGKSIMKDFVKGDILNEVCIKR